MANPQQDTAQHNRVYLSMGVGEGPEVLLHESIILKQKLHSSHSFITFESIPIVITSGNKKRLFQCIGKIICVEIPRKTSYSYKERCIIYW